MQRLVTAGPSCPERAGQPVKVWAQRSPLADLMALDGSSALLEEWTGRVRAQWAGHRAEASAGGGDGGAWLDGDAAAAMACDAAMAPIVTGEVNPGALEDLVRLCVELERLRHHPRGGQDDTGTGGDACGQDALPPPTPPGPGTPSSGRSSARRGGPDASGPGGLASFPAAPAAARRPAGRAISSLPLDIGYLRRRSRPGSATRSSCGTGTASGPGAVQTSPRRRAKCTTSSTRPTAARPASGIVFYFAGFITRW